MSAPGSGFVDDDMNGKGEILSHRPPQQPSICPRSPFCVGAKFSAGFGGALIPAVFMKGPLWPGTGTWQTPADVFWLMPGVICCNYFRVPPVISHRGAWGWEGFDSYGFWRPKMVVPSLQLEFYNSNHPLIYIQWNTYNSHSDSVNV